jgi:hypothetical protein
VLTDWPAVGDHGRRDALEQRATVPAALLETTRQADLQPFVVGGAPVFRSLRRIRAELRSALSEQHALLFAEPAIDAAGDIRWYAPAAGLAMRLQTLAPAVGAEVAARLARRVLDIAQRANELLRSGDEDDRLAGGQLALALELPDERHIFVVGGEPVIAAWGHGPLGAAEPQQLLLALANRTQDEPPVAKPPLPVPDFDELMAAFDGVDTRAGPPPPLQSQETETQSQPASERASDDARQEGAERAGAAQAVAPADSSPAPGDEAVAPPSHDAPVAAADDQPAPQRSPPEAEAKASDTSEEVKPQAAGHRGGEFRSGARPGEGYETAA